LEINLNFLKISLLGQGVITLSGGSLLTALPIKTTVL